MSSLNWRKLRTWPWKDGPCTHHSSFTMLAILLDSDITSTWSWILLMKRYSTLSSHRRILFHLVKKNNFDKLPRFLCTDRLPIKEMGLRWIIAERLLIINRFLTMTDWWMSMRSVPYYWSIQCHSPNLQQEILHNGNTSFVSQHSSLELLDSPPMHPNLGNCAGSLLTRMNIAPSRDSIHQSQHSTSFDLGDNTESTTLAQILKQVLMLLDKLVSPILNGKHEQFQLTSLDKMVLYSVHETIQATREEHRLSMFAILCC